MNSGTQQESEMRQQPREIPVTTEEPITTEEPTQSEFDSKKLISFDLSKLMPLEEIDSEDSYGACGLDGVCH